MINPYTKISIIYGGRGKKCAEIVADKLNKMHFVDGYPFIPSIVAKAILGGESIFSIVKKTIADSKLCIIILTFDDVNETRIRQNVLIEIGMALMILDSPEKCIFLSEKRNLPDDFPSDIKGIINANYFTEETMDSVADNLANEIKNTFNIPSHNNLLDDINYDYRYEDILNDIPKSVFEEKSDIQLHHILDCWQDTISHFDFLSERVMYLLERIKFFPDFNNNDHFFSFIKNIKTQLLPSEKDFASYDRAYINNLLNIVNNILDYTYFKLQKDVIETVKNPSLDVFKTEEVAHKFHHFYQSLNRCLNMINDDEHKYKYNWLIQVLLKEYCALALMRYIKLAPNYENVIEDIKKAITLYNEMIDIALTYGNYSSSTLFEGYAQYDLTRAYKELYLKEKDESYLKKMKEYSLKSISTRKEWVNFKSFKGVFTSALSLEYFLVKRYELELQYEFNEYSNSTPEKIAESLIQLEEELKNYWDNTELGRLYEMAKSISSFQKKVITKVTS